MADEPRWKAGEAFWYVYAGAYACTGKIFSVGDTTATVHYDNFDGKYQGVPLRQLYKSKRTCQRHFTRSVQ